MPTVSVQEITKQKVCGVVLAFIILATDLLLKLFLNMKILNHTLQSYNEVKVRDREFNVVLPYEFFKSSF